MGIYKKEWPADCLSRLKISKFLKLVNNNVNERPTPIPDLIWPMNKIWLRT